MENPKIDPARLPELYEAVCQLHASLELEEVIDRTLQAAIKLTGAERAFIQFSDRYSSYALPKLATETEQLIRTALEELAHDVAQNRQGILITDTQIDPRFATEPLSALFASRTLLIEPLQVSDEFLGVLVVDGIASASPFTENEAAILKSLSAQAAIAVHHAQLYRSRASFISDLASEMRMPLISVRGWTDILLKKMAGPLTEMQIKALEIVSYNAERIETLWSNMIDITRIENQRVLIETKPTNLHECIESVLGNLNQELQGKRHVVTLHPSDTSVIHADPKRLSQVLTILLDNAIKYTPAEGKIDVSAVVQGSLAKVLVRDTGIGIEPQDQARVFQKWFRGADPLVREHPGNGLSLYTAKNLIELMGGAIGFESEPGKGSTFWFTLPIAEPEIPANP